MKAEDLKNYDITLIIDKSGSMATDDCQGGMTRWQAAKESAIALGQAAAKYDSDGITIVPFASKWKIYPNVTPDKIAQIFEENDPMGSTNTSGVLEAIFNDYFTRKASGCKPLIVQVITDGSPDSKSQLKSVIIAATKRMDKDEELAVQFIQIGHDSSVPDFLKELDDDLEKQGAKFDIVDYKTSDEAEGIPLADLLIQAVTD